MIGNTWFINDTHFGHTNILKFDEEQGSLWSNIHERDEELIERWNEKVAEEDEVFHLGDFAFLRKARIAEIAERLNGKKFLMLGNHDKLPVEFYSQFFKVIRQPFPWRDGVLLTHAPIHPMCLEGRWKVNIHGHIHRSLVRTSGWKAWDQPDPRYINVAVEQTNFAPRSAEELLIQASATGGIR